MKNTKKRLFIGSILFIGIYIAVIKMDALQVVSAKIGDAMNETMTIHYNHDNRNGDARAAVSPDRRHLAFCKGEKEFFVQELSTGIVTTYPTEEKIYQLKYSPNGIYLAAGRNVLNTKTGKVTPLATDVKILSTDDYIAFSPNNEILALVNADLFNIHDLRL